jgi:type I protein arginine methyltransferase
MFCAKAGAKRVIAVDKSDIIDKARDNIFHNGFSDTITCVQGMIEDVDLPVDQVDIIVSEWMGYFLLYEAMLPSILWARDRYLKPGGLLVPAVTTLWVAPISDAEYIADQVAFWRDIYGFDMKAMQSGIYDDARVLIMPQRSVCGTPFPFLPLPLHSIKTEGLTFRVPFRTTLSEKIESLDGFLVWFDTYFTSVPEEEVPTASMAETWARGKADRVAFTTGPFGAETHWKHGLLLTTQKGTTAELQSGCEITGEISYTAPEDNPRTLSIGMTWSIPGTTARSQKWKLQ